MRKGMKSRNQSMRRGRLALAVACLLMSPVAWSQTLPDSGTVVSGAATSDLDLGGVMNPGGGGTAMTITQTSPSAIINWYSFDVATGSTLTFAQPVGGVILNRVIGDGFTPITPSLINGIINGNGNVFIINPTGILFGSGSQVNVGGLVASTLDISDTDFNNGAAMPDPHYIFTTPSAPGGAIVNRGSLIAASGGTIALLAARIENQGLGTITAQDGSVVLGAGQSMNLDFYDDGLTTVTLTANGYDLDPGCASSPVPTSSCLGGIENSGTITADGGHIEMRTTTTDGLPSAATLFTEAANGGRIWIGGSVIANTTASRAGSIILDAGMGNIDIGGIPGQAGLVQADATGAGMDAGTVDIRGNQLFTYGCVVPGGVCAITDAYGVIDVNAYGAGGDGGMITINVAGDLFHAGVLRARSPQGNGGLIEINAGNSAEVHNLISAEGGVNGGIINLTAPSILLHRGQMPWLGGSGILYSKAVLDVVGSTDGGSVYLTAGTQLNVVDLGDVAVNQSVIDAAGLNGNGGLIYVYGPTINIGDTRFANASGSTDGGSIMLYGDITLNGWLEADGARYYGNTIGDGGYISLRGPNINIASSAHLTANGGATYGYGPSQTSNGGYIIISGDTVDVSGEFHARGASGGGGITDRGSQLLRVEASTQVDADSWYIIGGDVWVTTNAGSASHTAGAVVVDAALSTALGLGTQVSVLARTTSGGTGTLNFVDDPVITNAGGDAALQFEGPYGIFGDGLSIATTSGQTELAFHGGYGGVHLDNFSIDTSGGGIVITAYEEIELANGSIRTDGGQVILDATYSTYGILVDNSSVVTAGGGIEIRADGAVPALGRSIEIRDSQLDSDGGGIRMASGAAMGLGITINNSSVESDGGRITLYASDSGYGIYVFGSSLLDSDSGDLVLVADNSADISIVGSTINAGTVAVQADNGLGISLTDSTITSNGDIALHAGNSVTGVQINYLTHISSAIGDIDIYGTTTTGAKGVQVYYSSITSTSGDISITGSGVSWGVDLWYADITTTTGAILANGISNGANGNGVRVLHSDLSTTGGAIFLSGSSTGATSRGVRVWYSDLASGGGDIVVQGDGTLQGVTLFHADLSSDGGAIQMTGTGGWYGLTVSTSNLLSDGGDILLSGSGDDSGVGLQLNTMVSSNGGDIDIVGHGGQSIYSAGPNTVFGGVAIWNDSQVTSAGGDIYVLGTGANAGSFGVYLNDSGTALSSGGGVLTVAGDAAGTGLLLNADTSIDGGAGVVVLRAGNDGSSDAIVLGGQIASTTAVNLRPFDATDTLYLGSGNGFVLDKIEFSHIATPWLVLGSSLHQGAIQVLSDISFGGNLTLQNQGGSAGIHLAGALDVSGHTLGLLSGGDITQTSAGAITAESLLAIASGNVLLNTAANDVTGNTLAGSAGGDFNYQDVDALAIGNVSVLGFNASSGAMTSQSVSGIWAGGGGSGGPSGPPTVGSGDVLVLTQSGNLTLGADVHGTNIDLVAAGIFLNPNGHVLQVASSGSWRIWASTWEGEDRGGLVGSGPLPDLYGCAYLGACGAMVGNGNQFIYVQQPPVSVSSSENSGRPVDILAEMEDGSTSSSSEASAKASGMCPMTDMVADVALAGSDPLGNDWMKVRKKLNLVNCFSNNRTGGCSGF